MARTSSLPNVPSAIADKKDTKSPSNSNNPVNA